MLKANLSLSSFERGDGIAFMSMISRILTSIGFYILPEIPSKTDLK
jgi:hypothetical protein